ncbi:MAG: helix-turn-helix transcriptional regulator [Planctomycetes bacterium]|nr:helix-turn-helix transcriptional regulator [Planctomycetota bacterium]
MGKMPNALRENIARNIRDCRLKNFPGRGGGKRCAESFGVSPQQWSPWESGKRTPDELRLEEIAKFFGTTVEWFRRDHRQEGSQNIALPGVLENRDILGSHTLGGELSRRITNMPDTTDEEDINHYLWAVDILTRKLTARGIKITVTFERTGSMLTNV